MDRRATKRASSSFGAVAMTLLLFVACTNLDNLTNGSGAAPDGGGGGDSSVVEAASPCLDLSTDPNCSKGCRDGVIYVSSVNGNDTAHGCSKDAPKKTIMSAVSFITTASLTKHTVQVCAGPPYEEAVAITTSIALRGGYDCTSWQRPAVFPGNPQVTETIITPAAASASEPTMEVRGIAVDATSIVEGFTITGGALRPIALRILEGARPIITKNRIIGGSTNVEPPQSSGLAIGGASPDVVENDIRGGSVGGETSSSTTGIFVFGGGSPHIHKNVVRAGKLLPRAPSLLGSRGAAAIRIGPSKLVGAGQSALEQNTFVQATGACSGGPCSDGIQVAVVAGGTLEADILDNVVQSQDNVESLSCAEVIGNPCIVRGIALFADAGATTSAITRIQRNRVHPGNVLSSNTLAREYQGISINNVNAEIANNFIHSGGITTGSTTGAGVRGIRVTASRPVTLLHNTIVVGNALGGAGVDLDGAASAAMVNNLLLFGVPTPAFSGIRLSDAASRFVQVKNNAFVGDVTILEAPAPVGSVASILATESQINGPSSSVASNNVRVASACTGDTTKECLGDAACAVPGNCIGIVLAAYTASTYGRTELFADGWKLAQPGVPCRIATGGLVSTSPFAAADFFNAPRTPSPSIGAQEQELCAVK